MCVGKTAILILFAFTLELFEGKLFGRCGFVQELQRYGVPDWQIPTFTCIAEWASGFNSSKADYEKGTHGIFQINEYQWCSPTNRCGNICKVTCSSLRDDSLHNDIACAMKMYRYIRKRTGVGYDAWDVFHPGCTENDNKRYTDGCEYHEELL